MSSLSLSIHREEQGTTNSEMYFKASLTNAMYAVSINQYESLNEPWLVMGYLTSHLHRKNNIVATDVFVAVLQNQ